MNTPVGDNQFRSISRRVAKYINTYCLLPYYKCKTNCRFISERELTFTFAICCRPSVCLKSVCLERSCTLLSRLKFSAICLRHLVPCPFFDIRGKFYEDRPRGTPQSGELNARGVAKYSHFGPIEGYISERVQDRR